MNGHLLGGRLFGGGILLLGGLLLGLLLGLLFILSGLFLVGLLLGAPLRGGFFLEAFGFYLAAGLGPRSRVSVAGGFLPVPVHCDRLHLELEAARARDVEHLHLDAARAPAELRRHGVCDEDRDLLLAVPCVAVRVQLERLARTTAVARHARGTHSHVARKVRDDNLTAPAAAAAVAAAPAAAAAAAAAAKCLRGRCSSR
eukprot:scaffold71517_cov55-Phaeocystis_antarctica.AAC.7